MHTHTHTHTLRHTSNRDCRLTPSEETERLPSLSFSLSLFLESASTNQPAAEEKKKKVSSLFTPYFFLALLHPTPPHRRQIMFLSLQAVLFSLSLRLYEPCRITGISEFKRFTKIFFLDSPQLEIAFLLEATLS